MYQIPYMNPGTIQVNQATEGQTLEIKVERLMHEKSPLAEPGQPLIFEPREEGIRASTNIRTDRWEVAIEATDKIAKSYKARREERAKKAADREPEKSENIEKTKEKEEKPTA